MSVTTVFKICREGMPRSFHNYWLYLSKHVLFEAKLLIVFVCLRLEWRRSYNAIEFVRKMSLSEPLEFRISLFEYLVGVVLSML